MSYLTTDTEVGDPRFGNAWRTDRGTPCASVHLGKGAYLAFESAGDARAVAAACTEAAEAMERLAKGESSGG
jgi:hypothetical protein